MNFFKKSCSVLLVIIILLSIISTSVFAVAESEGMSDEFSKVLTEGKLLLNCVKPNSHEDDLLWTIADDFNLSNSDFFLNPYNFSEDFSKIELIRYTAEGEEKNTVDVVWKYDADVLNIAKSLSENFPEAWSDYIYLELTDLELVNYWVYKKDGVTKPALANYSSELKSAVSDNNFYFEVQVYGGGREPFYTTNGGVARLMHNGNAYKHMGGINAFCHHAIYVPESTGNTKQELIAAAQKRINDYIGNNKLEITDAKETVPEYINDNLINYEFIENAVGGYVFDAKVLSSGEIYKIIIIKDDTKLTIPSYTCTDAKTDVSVSTDSSEIPLDTLIKVEKITHGEEHERICGTLEIKDGEIYDIKLHSGTLDDYITKLKNGKFKVRLPIKNEYKGKELVVYYVDANGNKTKYNVTVKNNFAFFETDHFSVYTLTVVAGDGFNILGDCNSDGKVDTTDLAIMKLFLAGAGELSDTGKLGGDLSGDGKVDTTDLAMLKLKLAGNE